MKKILVALLVEYYESCDNNNILYFVEGETVSQNIFSIYLNKQEEKGDVVWNVYLPDC